MARPPVAEATRRKRSGKIMAAVGIALMLLVILPVLLVPMFSGADPLQTDLANRLKPPGVAHLLGTDQLGRDLLARMAHGGRISLLSGTFAVICAGVLGVSLGLIAGYKGGVADALISRVIEMQLALPLLMLLLMIIAIFGQNLPVVIMVLAISQWPELARLARSLALVEREKPYIEAARSIGATTGRILWRHLIPNVIEPILTMLALLFAQAVLVESALSFLGLSVTRPHPTWGRILADGREYITTGWWLVVIPGLAISLLVLGLNLLAGGLRTITSRSEV